MNNYFIGIQKQNSYIFFNIIMSALLKTSCIIVKRLWDYIDDGI